MLAIPIECCRVRSGSLHHRRILVYVFDVVCESCSDDSENLYGYILGNPTGGCSLFYFGADFRCGCGHCAVQVVRARSASGSKERGSEGEFVELKLASRASQGTQGLRPGLISVVPPGLASRFAVRSTECSERPAAWKLDRVPRSSFAWAGFVLTSIVGLRRSRITHPGQNRARTGHPLVILDSDRRGMREFKFPPCRTERGKDGASYAHRAHLDSSRCAN
jgi:hypothetical protein